ncbi:conserved unknown protein [Ectocarpus siliculosus]|uniref:Uncharacterized protein n=1 Tax=Ectocarpus siliculosus TaxID=2880 RepID=D8LPJ0_ECTSI|nr:conserved unknown protein [Ectocarpus siliculosus]|eukprot:CBN80462.1 conserved unknown protein [Ectocarpus siliculosus]
MLSDIISLGPTSLISQYDGGGNFFYMGCLTKDVRGRWPLATTTALNCIISSTTRLAELPIGPFRTKCLIQGLVRAVDTQQCDTLAWIVPRLPIEYALFTDKLSCAVIETGVVSAISYAIPLTRTKKNEAPPAFRVSVENAVRKGHVDAAKFLFTRFADKELRSTVVMTACLEGDDSLVHWCAGAMMSQFPPEATRALVYRGNIDALAWLKTNGKYSYTLMNQTVLYAALGGHVEAVDWVLDNNPGIRYDAGEVCLMVCRKGLLDILKHLVVRRGFWFHATDCIRFAKKGSGIASWLMSRDD